jgi:hypothetical protein
LARSDENTGFSCEWCGADVPPLTNGSYRNHCWRCLRSKHVDGVSPGDRSSRCSGLMHPTGIVRSRKGWQLVHRCEVCGIVRRNRIAESTSCQDDFDAILELMRGDPQR